MEIVPSDIAGLQNPTSIDGPVIGGGPGPGFVITRFQSPSKTALVTSYASATGSAVGQPTRCFYSKNKFLVNAGSSRTCDTSD